MEKTGTIACTPRISLFIGTKAQFIKMIPVVWELEAGSVRFRFVGIGQKHSIWSDLRKMYAIGNFSFSLGDKRGNVNTLGRGLLALVGIVARCSFAVDERNGSCSTTPDV